jgi:TM2 domain-containing membrane protein YozV
MKQKAIAVLLCFFLGGIGAHKFYLGQIGAGIVYLLFFWTFIPGLIAFFEFFILLFMSDAEFDRQFNAAYAPTRTTTSATDTTRALAELKALYESGVITPEEYEQKRQNLLRQI